MLILTQVVLEGLSRTTYVKIIAKDAPNPDKPPSLLVVSAVALWVDLGN
jgi:hypothetical protein